MTGVQTCALPICSRHFGTRSYGAIYGLLYSIFVLGYGLSPFFVGLARDGFGNYDHALLGSMAAVVMAAVLALFLKVPPRSLAEGSG